MKKLYIFGVGLIGGSIALKARDLNIFDEIIGIGRAGGSSLDKLVQSGVLNSSLTQIGEEIRDANLIVIATPVAQTKIILKKIQPLLNPETIITDVGSTKSDIMCEAKLILNVETSSRCNVEEYTRSVESAYTMAYERYHDNLNPENLEPL